MTGMSTSHPKIAADSWLSRLIALYRSDTEFAQSIVRLLVGSAVTAYFYSAFEETNFSNRQLAWIAVYVVSSFIVFVAVSASVARWPGHFWYRRLFIIMLDYSGVTIFMSLGGIALAPLVAVFISITVGYGLRFGARYLVLALAFALLGAILVMYVSPFWYGQPFLCAMFILALLVSSLYPFALSSRINAAERAARLANAEKSRYLAQASHDLRQPIHAIGLLAAQLDENEDRSAIREIAGRIERAVHNATDLLQAFLDASVIESGTLVSRPENVNLDELFREVERQSEVSARWAGNEVRFTVTKMTVFADHSFLITMLQNLVSNAIKYAPGSKLLVGCRRRGGTLSLFVMDNGDGIAAQHLAKIKEPFYRAPSAGHNMVQGAGLGLAIVHRLSEIAELEFDLQSAKGRGTTAIISGLPIVEGDGVAEIVFTSMPIGRLTGMRVMLIEDDEETREATAAILGKWECIVSTYPSPPPSVGDASAVLSDFQFGDSETLADHGAFLDSVRVARIPLIMISGSDQHEIRTALKRADPLILAKPLRPAELRSTLMAAKLSQRD